MALPRQLIAVCVVGLLQLATLTLAQAPIGQEPGVPQQDIPMNQPGEVCRRTLDLVFAIDSSNSLGQQNFNIMMSTLSRAVNVLQFGPDLVRVGASVYSTTTDVIQLQTSQAAFQQSIASLVYRDEGTNADQGIRAATQVLTTDRRPQVPIAIMMVTDGASANRQAAFQARQDAVNRGVDFWAVGVGPLADFQELQSLASTPQQAFHIETFDRIPDQLISLTRVVCDRAVVRPDLTAPPISPLQELCQQSPSFEGARYIPYPEDCTRVMQCYDNEDGRMLVVTRMCPVGEFWDQTRFRCAPSWTVDCPYDKCRTCTHNPTTNPELAISTNGSVTFPMSGGWPCGGYWECINGRSYARCCPPLFSYQAGCGCKMTGQCWDACNINTTCADGVTPCYKYPDWSNAGSFYHMAEMGDPRAPSGDTMVPETCPYGGAFDITRCGCEDRTMDILRRRPNTGCTPLYQSQTAVPCNQAQPPIVMQGRDRSSPITLWIRVQLSMPGFEVIMSSDGAEQFSLRVVGDTNGIHAFLGTINQRGLMGNTTTLFMDATGQLDIVLMYHADMLTLSVTQASLTHVSEVEVAAVNICTNCRLFISTQGQGDCSVQRMAVYTCGFPLHNMYTQRS